MKERVVSVETAQLAKEKGFDWKCSRCYSSPPMWVLGGGWANNYNKTPWGLSAPNQAHLQQWLREEHSLHIVILPSGPGYFAFKIIDIQLDPENQIERPPYSGVDAYDYSTYEETLEAGLREALKSIKE